MDDRCVDRVEIVASVIRVLAEYNLALKIDVLENRFINKTKVSTVVTQNNQKKEQKHL